MKGLLALCVAVVSVLLFSPQPVAAQPITPSPDWRNTVAAPEDPFMVYPGGREEPRWIKFTILLSSPGTVYFQDSVDFPFHHPFAAARLDPYFGITRAAFDQITLHAAGQQAVLGAVLFPSTSNGPIPNEFAVQLVRNDAYTREQAKDLIQLVASKVTGAAGAGVLYFPTFEQLQAAQAETAYFASHGITVASPGRWSSNNPVYAQGWALGTLKYVPAAQIQTAYASGALTPDDILLTDGIPAELPYLAGILSLSAATPNSHVAILADTYGVPFAHLSRAPDAQWAQQLVGRRVVLRAFIPFGRSEVSLLDVHDTLPNAPMNEILALKEPVPLNFSPTTPLGAFSTPTNNLHPADIRYVGGKAANYGFIRRAIPGNSRPAAAFSFDLWNAYLNQTVSTGRTLRQEIDFRLGQHAWPPNFAQVATDLAGVRNLFTSTSATSFTPALQSAVLATLQDPQYGFDPDVKIRFRSSTNVEDAAQFTGAGLYESFSGCLRDDLDADTTGPSVCDPSEANERGVFRAIRRVFASFYNDNAFLHRLRFGVDEHQVGMGMLVHHSFPDETELANGVVTLTRRNANQSTLRIVSQPGATSVTNPEDGSIPEEVYVEVYTTSMFPVVTRASSRLILGETVMDWEDDYLDLTQLLLQVSNTFATETGDGVFTLDFEFKKTSFAGALEIKQVRELPQPSTTPSITPFLLNAPMELCTFQGEYGGVFANHRLKTRMSVETANRWLTVPNLQTSFITGAAMSYTDGCSVRTLQGPPSSQFNHHHSYAAGATLDQWDIVPIPNPRSYGLATLQIPTLVAPAESPLLTLADTGDDWRHRLELRVAHRNPVVSRDWLGNPVYVSSETAQLCPCDRLLPGTPVEREVSVDGVTILTRFTWALAIFEFVAGYTADLKNFEETVITGLTSQPIRLTGYFSQTYRPGHHNFTEEFIFDPRLDPAVTPLQLAELRAQAIDFIYLQLGFGEPTMVFYNDNCPGPCSADFNNDGDVGTDADIEDFFACLGGNCCATCSSADFDADGDTGTDLDIESFFRVMGGGPC